MFRNTILGALALALLAGPAYAGDLDRTNASQPKSLQVLNDVTQQVRTYTRFTIFDDVNVGIDNGVVRLTGKVTAPWKKDEIAARVARVTGVQQVQNDLSVLPVSPFDDELRYRIARAIYSNAAFWHYAAMAYPPIHIIVDRGNVTLTGVVNSNVERMLARSLATTFGAFSVKNELKTDEEVKELLEKIS
jgi:hyperosmotically inducible protein